MKVKKEGFSDKEIIEMLEKTAEALTLAKALMQYKTFIKKAKAEAKAHGFNSLDEYHEVIK